MIPDDFTTLDLMAVALFFALWSAFTLAQDHLLRGRAIINQQLVHVRREWMERMIERDNRIMDAVLVGHTMHSCTFLASTTVLILAGLVGSLGAIDKAHELLMGLSIAAKVSREMLEIKLVLMIGVFAFAFLKFTWGLRQFNYTLALMGSAPLPPVEPAERREMAANIADTLSMAVRAFNGGMRAYYFALAALCWFVDPRLFIAATLVVEAILFTRQAGSTAARHITAQRKALERRGAAIEPRGAGGE